MNFKVADNFSDHLVSRRTFLFTLAAVTCLPFLPEAKAAHSFAPFSFGYVTDTHVVHGKPDSYLLLQESQLFLQDCVKQLNSEKLDFVIFGGDQVENPGVDDANWQLFVDCAQILSCPWSFVLGEKDVSGNPPVDKMKLYGPDWKQKGIQTDKPYWSQSPLPGVHIVGLDTSRPESTAGDVSNEQLEWLKKDLSSNAGKFTIVFSHHPLLAPPPFDGGPPWDDYVTANGASVREILAGSKDVRLAINGHIHVNKVQQEAAIWYVSSASLDVYPCSYRIFRVTPQTIQMESYQVSYPALVKKAKQQLDGSTIAFQYNEQKPALFAEVAVGNRIDNMALLPLSPGQPAQQIDEKKLKKAKEEQARKEQEEVAKGDKKKGKGEDKKSQDKKGQNKKGDDKKAEDKQPETKSNKKEQSKSSSTEEKAASKSEKKSKSKSDKKKTDDSTTKEDTNPAESNKPKSSSDAEAKPADGDKPEPSSEAEPKPANGDKPVSSSDAEAKPDSIQTPKSDSLESPPSEKPETPKIDNMASPEKSGAASSETKKPDSSPQSKAQPSPN
ncbi:MAG: hypothetical protein EKK48_20975 [Candidatus Melainabacteria bacterium]|nr:MAG: hypothetical protein EKK48_20975 [Candidatus Melainabacteria bacterium]